MFRSDGVYIRGLLVSPNERRFALVVCGRLLRSILLYVEPVFLFFCGCFPTAGQLLAPTCLLSPRLPTCLQITGTEVREHTAARFAYIARRGYYTPCKRHPFKTGFGHNPCRCRRQPRYAKLLFFALVVAVAAMAPRWMFFNEGSKWDFFL